MNKSIFNTAYLPKSVLTILAVLFVFAACSEDQSILQENAISESESELAKKSILNPDDEHSFDGPMFDIAALPNGGILVADFATIKEISNRGVHEITTLPLVTGPGAGGGNESTFINGLEPIGNGNFFATRSGLDLAVGAALFRTTRGNERMVGDIESFTLGDWQEVEEGEDEGEPGQNPAWKNFDCEPPGGFSAGPHSNPYHLTALSGSEVLIADAAGNSLLHATTNGNIEVVAYLPPVVDPITGDELVQFPLDDDINCPVEPVPTAVAVGNDGAYYVSELTGTTAENLGGEASPEGLASIWRVEPGSRNVDCPSEACTKVLTGLNSVIDIEFGPDGYLYVVEYEKNGFFATVVFDDEGNPVIPPVGGAVKKCDIKSDTCGENNIIYGGENSGLMMPGAITFDKWDNLWLLENVFAPTVRTIDWN
jgi:hypothetical protein